MSGDSPRRWRKGINMIEKKKDTLKMDKLRTILLYEVDFNMNNEYMGRDMMYKAEVAHLMAEE